MLPTPKREQRLPAPPEEVFPFFADAANFRFVFVGSFEVDAIKPLVERYLASLPALGRVEAAVDRGVRTPEGVVFRAQSGALSPDGGFRRDPY